MHLLDIFDEIFGKPKYEDKDCAVYVLDPPRNTWHDKCVHLLDPSQCVICKKEEDGKHEWREEVLTPVPESDRYKGSYDEQD